MKVLGPELSLKTKACRTAVEAWQTWRGERLMPAHSDVDPGALKWILARIGLIEVRGGDVATYRVAGSALRDTVGFDPTGRNLVELSPPEQRPRRAYRLAQLVARPCGYVAELNFAYSTGVTDMFESVALPLSSDQPETRGFVLFAMESILGRRWQNDTGRFTMDVDTEIFDFLDIGAGVPESTEPPGAKRKR